MDDSTEIEIGSADEDRLAHRLARQDVIHGLDEWFTPADGEQSWRARTDVDAAGPLTNGRVEVVAWRYDATPRSEIWGVAEDQGSIAVDGVTFVDADDENRFVRYIDWHGVFTQLGVAAAGHIVREPPGR